MQPRYDLHCHSTCSDGTFTPEELILHAKEIGLAGLSITDHDTVAAYPKAIDLAKRHGLVCIPGSEFSTDFEGEPIHVLAYNFDWEHSAIQSLCAKHLQRRHDRLNAMIARLKQEGISLTFNDLKTEHIPGRPHLAQVLVDKGFATSIDEAFRLFLREGKPGFVKGDTISVNDTLDVIHSAGGIAIIAHPHLIKSRLLVKKLLNLPFDGIECYYGRFHANKERPWLNLARDRNLLITGGSDFHGAVKPQIPLGCSWIDQSLFDRLSGQT